MIIEYATKEIRDCVLRDLWLEVSAGCYENKCESFTKFKYGGIRIDFEDDISLRIFVRGDNLIMIQMDAERDENHVENLYTICDIIDFLKAGEKK